MILGDELESGDPADLIRRVEDLLGKTKAKDGAPKSVRLRDGSGKKWVVKETFRSKESEQLLLRRTQQPQDEPSDLRVEVSEPGRRKIINMSESGSSEGGLLEAQEAALDEVITVGRERERGREERRRSRSTRSPRRSHSFTTRRHPMSSPERRYEYIL